VIRKLRRMNWRPPAHWQKITAVDMHTGGEPLRILVQGIPKIKGKTILEKRKYFREHLDYIRKTTMWEPRGHADMYGAVLTDPCTRDADFGVIFMHNEGYSTMCGHAIIALTKFVLETKLVWKRVNKPEIRIDAPPGQIVSTARKKQGVVTSVSFRNVPSFVLIRDQHVQIPGVGRVSYDVAYGGAFYAIVDAAKFGLTLNTAETTRLIDLGMRIKKSISNIRKITHPFEEDLSFLYGTIFTGKPYNRARHSRNVCIFANGEVDRSPTGTGISARAALLHARGELRMGERIAIESIVDSVMEVKVAGLTTYGPHKAIIPEITGSAFFTGISSFYIDPDDPFREGFILR
jgi:proline racemase